MLSTVLCWCRKLPGARDKQGYAAEVLATLEEGNAAQAAVATSFRSWQMPVAALMALQKNGWAQPRGSLPLIILSLRMLARGVQLF